MINVTEPKYCIGVDYEKSNFIYFFIISTFRLRRV